MARDTRAGEEHAEEPAMGAEEIGKEGRQQAGGGSGEGLAMAFLLGAIAGVGIAPGARTGGRGVATPPPARVTRFAGDEWTHVAAEAGKPSARWGKRPPTP